MATLVTDLAGSVATFIDRLLPDGQATGYVLLHPRVSLGDRIAVAASKPSEVDIRRDRKGYDDRSGN